MIVVYLQPIVKFLKKHKLIEKEKMEKNKDKKITVDRLALMIGKGFAGVDKKFTGVHKKLEAMDKKLDRIEYTILEKHADEIKYLKERVSKLEEALAIE